MTRGALLAETPAPPALPGGGWRLRADAAWRLGPRAVALFAWHRARLRLGLAQRALARVPAGWPAPAAGRAGSRLWHGPFDGGAPALGLDLFGPGDIRPVWEANRLGALFTTAAPDALLADWAAHNPPFRGPAWACGQEAALRALQLCLFDALRGPRRVTPALLAAHARRIEATRAYAAAQDNNHAVSEPAGLFVLGLALRDDALARRGARGLARAVARLVAPDGAFAQASPGYHRLLLDTLSLAEWFRRRHGAPDFAAPFAQRARAATLWLHRVAAPGGALPRTGACDDSALADLSGGGPGDARGSLERAARLFCGASAGHRDDPGCALLGLPCPAATLPREGAWRSEGWCGERRGALTVLLRTGVPLRFRPAQADLLHLELWHGDTALLRDGGSGSYNPPAGCGWWTAALAGTAGHNTIMFDGREQMPRVSRFLRRATTPSCSTGGSRCRASRASCSHTGRPAARCPAGRRCATGAAAGTSGASGSMRAT